MPGKMKKGQSIFIPFKDGESIYDSQNKARMYMSEEKFRASFPGWRFGEVDLVEYVPKYSEVVPKWISVEERLPDNSFLEKEIIICVLNRFGERNVYTKKFWGVNSALWNNDVTHWMPLPEPPEVEV